MSAGDLRTQLPRALRPVNDEGGLPHLRTIAGSQTAPPLTVAALCQDFAPVCESAVDPLEIASALEFDGMSDQMVRDRYGYPDVFELAAEMYIQVPRQPAEPPPPADPWQVSRLQPALHGLLYGLPAVCFPAAAVLLAGPGMHAVLIIALLAAWASSQGLAGLGYLRLGRTTDRRQAKRLLRAGLLAGLVLLALIMSGTAMLVHARLPVLLFGLAEGAYMLGACVLLVLGAERWLLAVLAPGVLGSAAFLALGRPPNLQHASWIALAATPVLAVVAALVCTRGGRGAAGRLVVAAELRAAAPAAVFGLLAAGLLAFPVIAGANGHGGVNVGALLATLPLSLSMGAAEWSLLAYRRRTRDLLRSTHDLRALDRRRGRARPAGPAAAARARGLPGAGLRDVPGPGPAGAGRAGRRAHRLRRGAGLRDRLARARRGLPAGGVHRTADRAWRVCDQGAVHGGPPRLLGPDSAARSGGTNEVTESGEQHVGHRGGYRSRGLHRLAPDRGARAPRASRAGHGAV
jgi:hypothetical protein